MMKLTTDKGLIQRFFLNVPSFLLCQGEAGVRRVLEILRDEFDIAMALAGCKSIADITSDLVDKRPICSAQVS